MSKILIIPDAHASPAYDNDRFDWLGRFIVDEQPDIIIQLGDFGDMPSLSSYDKGKKSFEGRRYIEDIQSVREAMDRLLAPLKNYNKQRRKKKEKQYKPRRIIILGNHEDRINRTVQCEPQYYGTISTDDLWFDKAGWEVYGFLEVVFIEGFCVSHYFPSAMGRAIGGKNLASRLITEKHASVIVGHSHLLDISERTRADGTKMLAIVGGCYVHPECIEDWNRGTFDQWWNGVIMLEGAKDGYYKELRLIRQEVLKEKYG